MGLKLEWCKQLFPKKRVPYTDAFGSDYCDSPASTPSRRSLRDNNSNHSPGLAWESPQGRAASSTPNVDRVDKGSSTSNVDRVANSSTPKVNRVADTSSYSAGQKTSNHSVDGLPPDPRDAARPRFLPTLFFRLHSLHILRNTLRSRLTTFVRQKACVLRHWLLAGGLR